MAAGLFISAGVQACGPDGPPYPYYYYTGPCGSDVDCYPQSYCIEPAPGTCNAPCRTDLDCPAPSMCRPNKRRGAKGDIAVCSYPP